MSISPVRLRAGARGNDAAIPLRVHEAIELRTTEHPQEDVLERFVDSACSQLDIVQRFSNARVRQYWRRPSTRNALVQARRELL
ncbi:MAG: hypothetical protein MPJ50_02645 [Pirellulales bacterium]|nr:hypothetical protein [Pirellulales bacterium]